MNYPSYYDGKSSEDEIITNVVNRNLDPPFIENKHEIRMNHDNDQNDEVVYRMNKLTLGGNDPVSSSSSEAALKAEYENDPFKRDEVYAYSTRGLGPQSLLSTWDPLVGSELYTNWMKMMRAQQMQGRLQIAQQFLVIFGGITIGLFSVYWIFKRFRLCGPLMRKLPKWRVISRSPAELKSKISSKL